MVEAVVVVEVVVVEVVEVVVVVVPLALRQSCRSSYPAESVTSSGLKDYDPCDQQDPHLAR